MAAPSPQHQTRGCPQRLWRHCLSSSCDVSNLVSWHRSCFDECSIVFAVSTNLDRTGYLNRKQLHQAVLGLCFKLYVKLKPSEISARTEASQSSERVTFQGFCEWILDTFPEICQSDADSPARIGRARSTIN